MKQLLLALISAVLMMTACTLLESNGDTSSLAVTLPDSGTGRSLQAEGNLGKDEVKAYKVTITSGESSMSRLSDPGETVFFPDISTGNWEVSAEAFSGQGLLVAVGKALADVEEGNVASVTVTLVKVNYSAMSGTDEEEYFSPAVVYDIDMYDSIIAGDEKIFRVVTSEQFQQLQALSKDSSKDFSGATIRLLKDVESSSDKYLKDFAGTFDGGKHTVTLNGYGLVAGKLSGTVKNVITAGTVTERLSNMYGAGIAAETVDGAFISCCINRATGTIGGGIVGCVTSGSVIVERCGNEAEVTSSYESPGGIIGTCKSSIVSITVSDSYNVGKINERENDYSGGIIGYGYYGTITLERCYDWSPDSTYEHDLVGSGNKTIIDCYSAHSKGTDSYRHGTKVTDFSDPSQFPGFDFVNVWEIKNGRPVLRDIQ